LRPPQSNPEDGAKKEKQLLWAQCIFLVALYSARDYLFPIGFGLRIVSEHDSKPTDGTMASQKYAAPLRLEPEKSRRLALIVMMTVLGALILPFTVSIPFWARLISLAVIAGLGYRVYRNHFGAERIIRAIWEEHGEWQIVLANGTQWPVQLEGDSFVTPELMILNFRAPRRRFHLIVLADVLHPVILRRLRVRLRLEQGRNYTK
jgi:hypothetical protein